MNTATASEKLDKLWDYNAPEKTREQFLEYQKNVDKTTPMYLELLTQLARTHSLQQQFTEAHGLLDRVESEWTRATPVVQIRYFLERGRTYNSAGDKQSAGPLFQQALEVSTKHELDFYAVDAAHMLAIVADSEAQIAWNLKAIELAENAKEERAKNWLGSLYNNLGWTYHDLKNYPEALQLFEKNVRWHQERNSKEGLVIALWSVARVQRSLGHYEQALAAQQQVVQKRKDLGLSEGGYAYEEIAENLWALKRAREARPFFKKAYDLLSQDPWLQSHESERLKRLKSLSE